MKRPPGEMDKLGLTIIWWLVRGEVGALEDRIHSSKIRLCTVHTCYRYQMQDEQIKLRNVWSSLTVEALRMWYCVSPCSLACLATVAVLI